MKIANFVDKIVPLFIVFLHFGAILVWDKSTKQEKAIYFSHFMIILFTYSLSLSFSKTTPQMYNV